MSHSGTVTFLFTDLVGSAENLRAVGDETGSQLFRTHRELLANAVNGAGGEEPKWLDDGVLAVFSSAADAVRCAIQVQQTARRPAVCEVVCEHKDPAALLRKTPFVGRAGQMERLARKLEIASGGQGAVAIYCTTFF